MTLWEKIKLKVFGIKPNLPPPQLVREKEEKRVDEKFVINDAGLKLVEYYEGCELKSYMDSVGVWTIGLGRIRHDDGSAVGPGETCTQAQADAWLRSDLEKEGAHYVRAWTKELNENQFSALTSFCFNRGAGRLRRLLAMPGNVEDNLIKFDWAGSEDNHLLGLMRRRRSEATLYVGDDWTFWKGWKP